MTGQADKEMDLSWPVERAAGGAVVRVRNGMREVLLIDDAYNHVTFPKGHVEAGETWETAAIREVFEETGIEARIVSSLGRVEYRIERHGQPVRKQVRLFLLEVIDEADEPNHQAEEVRGAYFLSWQDAQRAHEQRGYENWSWVLPKARVWWEWHEKKLESEWRQLPADAKWDDILHTWQHAEPAIKALKQVVLDELAVVAPNVFVGLGSSSDIVPAVITDETPAPATESIPRGLVDEGVALRQAIEHTLLKPEASELDVYNLAQEAVERQFRAVCVNPQHAGLIARVADGSAVVPCVVIGFPLGAADLSALVVETQSVIEQGAREVDLVIPVGSLREDDIWTVYRYVQAVTQTAHALQARVKVILEAHFLTSEQLLKGCLVSLAAHADFVKTSTGFAPSGAKLADIALMRLTVEQRCGVKAAGGIRNRLQATRLLQFGADRLGTSSGLLMIRQ